MKQEIILLMTVIAALSFLIGAVTTFMIISAPAEKVLVQDNLEAELTNWYSSGDEGGSIVKDAAFYMSPSSSMKIVTQIGNDKMYYAERGISRPSDAKIGLDFWWQINGFAKFFEFRINWYYFENEAVRRHFASLRYDVENTSWEYLASDGHYHSITDGVQNLPVADTAVWIHSKLVVDFETQRYVKFFCADRKYDLSALGLCNVESFGNERIDWRFSAENRSNEYSAVANVDDVRVTVEK